MSTFILNRSLISVCLSSLHFLSSFCCLSLRCLLCSLLRTDKGVYRLFEFSSFYFHNHSNWFTQHSTNNFWDAADLFENLLISSSNLHIFLFFLYLFFIFSTISTIPLSNPGCGLTIPRSFMTGPYLDFPSLNSALLLSFFHRLSPQTTAFSIKT